jgi:acyl-CoA reductase-like NAD-dependent aldehyde dehydrogenase
MSVETITTISPNTNEAILTRNGASAADLESLPKVATEAFQNYRKTTLKERQAIVRKFLDALLAKKDELGEELTVQMGRPISYTPGEVATAVKRGEYLLKISDEALKDTDGEAEKGFKRFIRKVPVGPVLIIFAWNVSAGLVMLHRISPSTDSVLLVPLPYPGQLSYSRSSRRMQCNPQALTSDSHHC